MAEDGRRRATLSMVRVHGGPSCCRAIGASQPVTWARGAPGGGRRSCDPRSGCIHLPGGHTPSMADGASTPPVAPDHEPTDLPERPREFRIGRAAFLATVVAGVGGIFLGPRLSKLVTNPLAGVLPSSLGDLIPGNGWRIYNVQDPFPTFHPAPYRLVVDGLVTRPRR